MGAQCVQRDVKLAGDLGSGELAVQKPQHLQFALAQYLAQALLRHGRYLDGGGRAFKESPGLRVGIGSVLQQSQHRGALVQVQADVAVRFWRGGEASAECGERLGKVTSSV